MNRGFSFSGSRRLLYATTLMFGSTLLLSACAPAPDEVPDTQDELTELDIEYTRHVLDNGLTLIVHEDPRAPVAAVNLWYRVGSRDESDGERGFAHLFEHLMYLGSEHHDSDYFEALEQLGATDMNATTSRDRTNYFQNIPVSALDRVLWLESDRMGHFAGALTEQKVTNELGVVENEKRQQSNRPYGDVYKALLRYSYPPEHPYHWPTIGSMDDMRAATLDDLRDWHRRYYGAANAVLVIAGAVDTAEVVDQVEHYFGHIRPGPPVERMSRWVAPLPEARRKTIRDNVAQARIYRVWNVPAWGEPQRDYLALGAWILGGSSDSRLHRRLVRDDQLATGVSAYVSTGELGSQFVVVVTARGDATPGEVERAMDQEINRLVRRGPSEQEVERARTATYGAFARGLERVGGFGGKSDMLAMSEVYAGDPGAWRAQLQRYTTVQRGQITHSLREWLTEHALTLEVRPEPAYRQAEDRVDRSGLPAVDTPPDLSLPDTQTVRLDNGMELRLAQREDTPLVEARLLLGGGHAAEAGHPGLASLALGMLREGTDRYSATELAAREESLGASIGASAGLDAATLSLSALRARLDPSLELFAEIVRAPQFPERELERRQQQRLAAIEQELTSPGSLAWRVMPVLLYGEDHPYGQPFTGTGYSEVIADLGRPDLMDYHARWFRPEQATLVVVGDISMAQLRSKVERHFGDWQAATTAPEKPAIDDIEATPQTRIYLVDRADATQGLILAGGLAPPRSDPQDIALRAANTVLGGSFSARLNRNLREQRGWSYGTRSSLGDARGPRPFVITAPVTTARTADAMREIRSELDALRETRPVSEGELERAINSMTLRLPGQHETTAAIAGSLASIVIHELEEDYFDRFISEARALDTDAVTAAARRLGDPGQLTWVIVGNAAELREQLEALAWAEVQTLEVR